MIPILVSTYLILHTFIARVKSETIQSNIFYTHNASKELADELTTLNNIAVKSCANVNLSCYRLLANPEQAVQAVSQYEQISDFSAKMYLYATKDDSVYSSKVYNSTANMIGRFYSTDESIIDSFSVIESPRLYPSLPMSLYSNQTDRYITYAVPIPWESEFQDKTWIYLIQEETILEVLEKTIPVSGATMLLLTDNQIIYSSDETLYDADWSQLIPDTEEEYYEGNVFDTKCMIFQVEGDADGLPLKVVLLAPTKVVMYEHTRLVIVFFGTYIAIILVGLILIILFSYKDYNPVLRLLHAFPEKQFHKEKDEMSMIESAIYGMVDQNKKLKLRASNQDEMDKQSLILKYLYRQILTIEELEDQLSKTGHLLEGKYYTVLCVFTDGKDKQKNDLLIEAMENLSHEGLCILGAYNVELDIIIFIVGMVEKMEITNLMIDTMKKIEESYDIRITTALGSAYPRYGMIYKAFSEALIALQFMPVYGEGSFISYDMNIGKIDYNTLYPQYSENKIIEAIRLRDIQKIEETFDSFIKEISNRNIPFFYTKHICFSLIERIDQLQTGWKSEQFSRDLYDILNYSLSVDSGKIYEKLEKIKTMVINAIGSNISDPKFFGLITQFIQENFSRSDFSISNVADHFNISASYMRRYFKQNTGKTIQQYVDDVRFEKATGMLQIPEIPIKQIVNEVGYIDYSSFIRKFKQRYGYTPGDYRKQYLLTKTANEE